MMEQRAAGLRHRLQRTKFPRWIGSIAYLLSAGVFVLLMSLPENAPEVAVGVLLGVGLLALIGWKVGLYDQICESLRLVPCLLALFFSAFIIRAFVQSFWTDTWVGSALLPVFSSSARKLCLYLGASFFLFFSFTWVIQKILDEAARFQLQPFEKKFLLWSTVILAVAGGILYALSRGFWSVEDVVYSLDSYPTSKYVFSDIYYVDIRHLNITAVSFPLMAIARAIAQMLGIASLDDTSSLMPMLLMVLNGELLLLAAVLLGRITGRKSVLMLYALSCPVWLFCLFIEKYNVFVFLLALFAYGYAQKRERLCEVSAVLAFFSLTSFALLFPVLLFHKKRKEILPCIARVAVLTLFVLALFGRINYLFHCLAYADETLSPFYAVTFPQFSLSQRLYACLDAIVFSFVPLPSGPQLMTHFAAPIYGYSWLGVGAQMNWLGLCILVICAIGLFSKKDRWMNLLWGYWAAMLFVLFVVFNWAPHESPLFSIHFSLAYIPLFVQGIEVLLRKRIGLQRAVLGGMMALCLVLNANHITSIVVFLVRTLRI